MKAYTLVSENEWSGYILVFADIEIIETKDTLLATGNTLLCGLISEIDTYITMNVVSIKYFL